jgi:hypothetical protein
MSESLELLFVLKQFLLKELARMIISIYVFVLPQKFKPGQYIFNASCGHLLRFEGEVKFGSFFYPLGKQIYHKTSKSCDSWELLRLVESTKDKSIISCKICKRYWDIQEHSDLILAGASRLQKKIMCFCNKISDQFPCYACLAKKCSLCKIIASGKSSPDLCSNKKSSLCKIIDSGKSLPVLCTYHYRCGTCKRPFKYEIPDCNRGRVIRYSCFACKTQFETPVSKKLFYDFLLE